VKESGYDGRPVVVIRVTDFPFLDRVALVTRQRLESIGFNVELRDMDWSTSVEVRSRKEPPAKGGWNILHTFFSATDVVNPAVHFGLLADGPAAWPGWPDIPQLGRLINGWVSASDEARRKQLASDIQKVALDEVAYVPWGEWQMPTAFRRNVEGILKFTAPLFWNVRIA
jgi:peptide/nickel transport system substrate-binding protein